MTNHLPIEPSQLYRPCSPDKFAFGTTAELEDLNEIIGQIRAIQAVQFGIGIQKEGYNLFVLGPSGLGKRSMVQKFLESKAESRPVPDDWCYINNFNQPHKPKALRLPCGRGIELSQHMEERVDYLRSVIPTLFESEEYRNKVEAINEEIRKKQEQSLADLSADAESKNIVLLRTQDGYVFAPAKDHEVIPPHEFDKLAAEEKDKIEAEIAELQQRLEAIVKRAPLWQKERSELIKQLNRETSLQVVAHVLDELRGDFSDLPEVLSYLDIVQQDMIDSVDDFRKQKESITFSGMTIVTQETFRRYQVNVLVSGVKQNGAPIICEDNPNYSNLVGRVEHVSQMGALVTDFTLIKPGALHRANGGYLLLDVRKVLVQPFAWEGLKRAMQSHEIHIESLGQIYSLISTVSLEPEPIPLNVKVVLFGDRIFYYLLQAYDPEFAELFKVAADFEERIDRNDENDLLYARLISTVTRREGLLPFDRGAVARVIEHCARQIEDASKLSMHMHDVADLLRESDFWAREANLSVINADNVQQSIDSRIYRQGRLKDRLFESILRDILVISTEGAVVGQINGLSVIDMGNYAFAQPTRITASTRLGDGKLINIEREVKLSGAIHSKGVLILSAFLAARYAKKRPLALSASLVFEQSYGTVEGDSASLAELCALLSNLAEVPIRQSLAVTGSVNQFGQVQAIGAVNEKIEGFFDICSARGLNGEQGVLIPNSNVKHLMLRHDVVQAAQSGQFNIFAIDNVDQAISILTGLPAGELDSTGKYAEGSVNHKVTVRLEELATIMQTFSRQQGRNLADDRDSAADNGEG